MRSRWLSGLTTTRIGVPLANEDVEATAEALVTVAAAAVVEVAAVVAMLLFLLGAVVITAVVPAAAAAMIIATIPRTGPSTATM